MFWQNIFFDFSTDYHTFRSIESKNITFFTKPPLLNYFVLDGKKMYHRQTVWVKKALRSI